MKKESFGYYPPTEAEYDLLWKDGLIILDTNVILDLYRIPDKARNELFDVLEELKDRIWIPHQVALEFQRNRLTVIQSERKRTSDYLIKANANIGELIQALEDLKIDQRSIDVDLKDVVENLNDVSERVSRVFNAVQDAQIDISATDPIRERISNIFQGRVGPAPKSQSALDEMLRDAEERYNRKIPPGFEDAGKIKKGHEETYISNHISYYKHHGDLIIWKQTIDKIRSDGLKNVLFITRDRKDDWWWNEFGRVIGPHPELMKELERECSIECFWMYTSSNFAEHASKFLTSKVSQETVREIDEAADIPSSSEPFHRFSGGVADALRAQSLNQEENNIIQRRSGHTTIRSKIPSERRVVEFLHNTRLFTRCIKDGNWLCFYGSTAEEPIDVLVLDGDSSASIFDEVYNVISQAASRESLLVSRKEIFVLIGTEENFPVSMIMQRMKMLAQELRITFYELLKRTPNIVLHVAHITSKGFGLIEMSLNGADAR